MIRHVNNEWVVFSQDGKKRLGSYASKGEAVKRLQQIEYFKNKSGATQPKRKQLGEH